MTRLYRFGYRFGEKLGFWLARHTPMRVALWYGRRRGWIT